MIKKFIVLMTPSLVRCFKPLIMTLPDVAVVAYYTGKFLNKIVSEIFIFLMDVIFYLVLSDLFIKINSFMLYYLCYNNVKIIRH